LLSDEAAEQLKQPIIALPLPYGMVLVLRDMEELTTEEVAQILKLREGTVRMRLLRARLFLRQQLDRMGERPRQDSGNTRGCRRIRHALRLHGRRGQRRHE
jgi:DNA-directed RNA polymerase specialized sigma24 family protein